MRLLHPILIPLLVSLAAGCRSAEPSADAASDAPEIIRAALANPEFAWETAATTHFQLHAPAGSYAAQRLDSIADEVERARAEVLGRLEEQAYQEDAQLFFVEDREQMRMLVGQPAGGWAVPDANAVFYLHNADASPPYRHELGHLYSYRLWGEPHAYWLSEGVGVFVVGGCARFDLHAWAAALRRDGELVSMLELEREFDFSRAAPHLQAGSFLQFVAETHGIDALKVLWHDGLAGAENATGLSVEELELAWRRHIDLPQFRRQLVVERVVTCE